MFCEKYTYLPIYQLIHLLISALIYIPGPLQSGFYKLVFGQLWFGPKNLAPYFPSHWITFITAFAYIHSGCTNSFSDNFDSDQKKLRATFSQLLNYIYYILFRTISIRTKKKLRATFSQLLNYIYYILFSDNFDSDKKTWRHIFPVTNLHLLHTFSDNFDSDKKLGAAFSQLLNYYSD
jgi:hypothetical protein